VCNHSAEGVKASKKHLRYVDVCVYDVRDVCVYETCGVSDVNAFGTARTSMFKATRLNSNAHM